MYFTNMTHSIVAPLKLWRPSALLGKTRRNDKFICNLVAFFEFFKQNVDATDVKIGRINTINEWEAYLFIWGGACKVEIL